MRKSPFLIAALFSVSVLHGLAAADAFSLSSSKTALTWSSSTTWYSTHVRITGPAIVPFEDTFQKGSPVSIPLKQFPNGQYSWELTGATTISAALKAQIQAARDAGNDALAEELAQKAGIRSATSSGSFQIANGVLYSGTQSESSPTASAVKGEPVAEKDVVNADDVIIQGSLAVGFDAVNGENFGTDTIRLKENNLRIGFDDTSVSSGFPANDWAIEANDSASGGASYLGIRDSTAGRMPFRVQAGAPEGSLWVDSSGNAGIGTTTPVLKLHLNKSDTPAVRMEQNSSGGFTAQTWDVAGNEANFFVRDVTNGSLLPFRIRPGAPTSSIDIAADGKVGMGKSNPSAKLHVYGNDGNTTLLVEEASGTTIGRQVFQGINNGPCRIQLLNSSATADVGGGGWNINVKDGTSFRLNTITPNGKLPFELTKTGDINIPGTMSALAFNTTSDRAAKHKNVPISPRDVLNKVLKLPIEEWSFIGDESASRHIGPMAQDFREQFGLGSGDKTINLMDSTGVALAAIQGLQEEVNKRDADIKSLSAQVQLLMKEVEALKKQSTPPAPTTDKEPTEKGL